MKSLPSKFSGVEGSSERKVSYLYEIISPLEGSLYLTCYDAQVEFDGQFWDPAPVGHTAPDDQDGAVSLTVSVKHPMIRRYFLSNPTEKLFLRVIRVNSGLPKPSAANSYQIFYGVLAGVAFKGPQCVLSFNPKIMNEKAMIPRFLFQKVCNWCLFQPGTCKLNADDYVTTSVILSWDLDTRSCVINAPEPSPDYWGLGRFHPTNKIIIPVLRSAAVDESTTRLFLASWPAETELTNSQVWPGCNKLLTTCVTKFNNRDNFGGHPYIPALNPVIDGVDGNIAGSYGNDTVYINPASE